MSLMRTIQKLEKESQLNSLIKKKKSQDFTVLFHSTWCDYCQKMLKMAEDKWVSQEGDETLYTISSWDIPHGFVAFGVTQTPTIVAARRGRVRKYEYRPQIYSFLSTEKSLETGRV